MKKYLIFDLDGTLIQSNNNIIDIIITHIISLYDDLDGDTLRYYILRTAGTPLKEQLQNILAKHDADVDKITSDIYTKLNTLQESFFPRVPELIQELSKEYTLFLSTGSSNRFVQETLERGEILENFSLVYGSDIIPKGPDHIELFRNYTDDENFIQNSVYIGDGGGDRKIAAMYGIDFIHIGDSGKDRYEIPVVTDIYNILDTLHT